MLLVHIGDGRLENFVTSHPLFRLPLFIMGVSAALLTMREVEYPQVIMIIIMIIIIIIIILILIMEFIIIIIIITITPR